MNQFYRYRDSLKDYENTELRRILRHNKQETPATGTEVSIKNDHIYVKSKVKVHL